MIADGTREADGASAPAAAGELRAQPRCPNCEYLLVGLPQPRCPECGRVTTWARARLHTLRSPQIDFERLGGSRRVQGFVQTWFTIVLLPWRFARQADRSIGCPHALGFGALCFLGATTAVFFGCDGITLISWLSAALAQIVVQALLLTALDFAHWHELRRSLGFWLAVGGYTSAIMLTEIRDGPPIFPFNELVAMLLDYPRVLRVWDTDVIAYVQMGSWLLVLSILLAFRTTHSGWTRVPLALAAAALLFVLYTITVEHVGKRFYLLLQ